MIALKRPCGRKRARRQHPPAGPDHRVAPCRESWTRTRPDTKNDQAHVEQKNFTHVKHLLGYGRIGEIEPVEAMNRLYSETWMPLRNHFIPVMKLGWNAGGRSLEEALRPGGDALRAVDEERKPHRRGAEEVEGRTPSAKPLRLAEAIGRGLKEVFGEQEIEEPEPVFSESGDHTEASRPVS